MMTKKEWEETLGYYDDEIYDIAITSGNPAVTQAKLQVFVNKELNRNWPEEVARFGGVQWQILPIVKNED